MPDTTPLPLPECPREDCPATINQPAPARPPVTAIFAAILAAADDAKRAHDQMCDLAETLLPAPQATKADLAEALAVRAERDALAAKVERVRVFAEQMVSDCDDGYADGYELLPYAGELLTILDLDGGAA